MIYFSTLIHDQFILSNIDINNVRSDFYDLISGYQNDFFGYDTQDLFYKELRHVHVNPGNKEDLKKWMSIKVKNNRKSDNLLFYTQKENNYLLISFISPRGHDVFKHRTLMLNMRVVAVNFINNGIVP